MKLSFEEICDVYWKYYISLEEQFVETKKYVEFDYVNNRKTYSMEYLKLFQAVCSEIDVIGKTLASLLDASFKPGKDTGINEWWYFITQNDKTLVDFKCNLIGKHELQPWKDYVVVRNNNEHAKKYILDEQSTPKGKTPSWWNDYNSVKHARTGKFEAHSTNYAKANLKNLFLAFSALYVLEVKFIEHIYDKRKDKIPVELESKLFVDRLPFYTTYLSIK